MGLHVVVSQLTRYYLDVGITLAEFGVLYVYHALGGVKLIKDNTRGGLLLDLSRRN